MTDQSNLNVVAIVITYKPDLISVSQLLKVLLSQVNAVVVIDNGSKLEQIHNYMHYFNGVTELIELGDNLGIAYAQNVGIDWARKKGAKYVLLMDQDSTPASDMVSNLLNGLSRMENQGIQPASVGPMYVDHRHVRESPFVRLQNCRFTPVPYSDESDIIPVDFLISSGCLIPVTILDQVGDMRSDMFIDYVDVEWGKRAQYAGFQSYGICAAKMLHSLGGNPINFFGRSVPTHTPLRAYYRFRNAVVLFTQPWTTNEWRIADMRRLVLQYVFFTIFLKPRYQHFKMMSLGLWHGIHGKMGKLK